MSVLSLVPWIDFVSPPVEQSNSLNIDYGRVIIFPMDNFAQNVGSFSQGCQPLQDLNDIFFTDDHHHADAVVEDPPHFFFRYPAFFLQ